MTVPAVRTTIALTAVAITQAIPASTAAEINLGMKANIWLKTLFNG
jgi:hypothetical protein